MGPVAQIPFRSLKRILDHSRVRFTANPKLALWAQTLGLQPFRLTKNGYPKFFNVRSREPGQDPIYRLLLMGTPPLQQFTLKDEGFHS
jgi:hypothetical protein